MKSIKKIIFRLIFFVPNYILEIWVFEARSFVGRTFTGSLKIDPSKENLINLGAGTILPPEFINVDFFFERKIDFTCDLRYPLRIQNESVNGIFCEHTMEHVNYSDNVQLFKECYRILKPGGAIRIVLPDVQIFTKKYLENDQEWFSTYEDLNLISSGDPKRINRRFATPMQAISFITQEYFHVSCWDEQTLTHFLKEAGFTNINRCDWRSGKHKNLHIDSDKEARKMVSIYMEAEKP
jgi:predicted SAM-dependent methyltransferase